MNLFLKLFTNYAMRDGIPCYPVQETVMIGYAGMGACAILIPVRRASLGVRRSAAAGFCFCILSPATSLALPYIDLILKKISVVQPTKRALPPKTFIALETAVTGERSELRSTGLKIAAGHIVAMTCVMACRYIPVYALINASVHIFMAELARLQFDFSMLLL